MKAAYIFDVRNRYSHAAKTVANGFKNAFLDRRDTFSFFDIMRMKGSFGFYEKIKLLHFSPDVIFTSLENIHFLPGNLPVNVKLVLWAPFYQPCHYEPQIHSITDETKKLLHKISFKNDLIVWSQHDDEINERFFSGYQKEMGLKFVQLLHAADKTKCTNPSLLPELDFVWVGNIGHRRYRYESFINPLKNHYKNHVEFTENNTGDPGYIESKQLYKRSLVAPNIHTDAQVNYQILINERVFTATILGGFQICDNPLARKYFKEDELLIAQNSNQLMEYVEFFRKNPEQRIPLIKKMQHNILQQHTYHHRIKSILSCF